MAPKIKPKSAQPTKTEETAPQPPTTPAPEAEAVPLAWLTVETLLIVAIVLLGLGLRLWNLGDYPLSDSEAQQSLVALQLYNGDQPAATTSYSPLLVSLNTLTFFLVHASEASARLVAVLFGTALLLLPLTLRRQLGAPVSLLAALLLAISPTALFLSRTLNSQIAVAVGALMIVSGFFNWSSDGRQRWLYLLAGGLAVLLTAGPTAYSMVVVFALLVLVRLPNFKTLWGRGLQQSQPPAVPKNERKRGDQPERKGLSPQLQQAGIFLLVTLIVLATAATLNFSGFGVTTGLFTGWLGRFGFTAGSNTGFNAVFLLTIYEPLLVVAGLAGLAYALLQRNLLQIMWVGWFLGALLLDLAMGSRPNGSVILSLVPLAFLAALALTYLWRSVQQRATWGNEGIIWAAGLVIIVFGYIGLTGWLVRDCGPDDTFCQYAWLQAVAALALFLVIAGFFWFINGAATALRGVALAGVTVGLVATISLGWRLSHGPLMQLGYQPLAGVPASTELAELAETLASESMVRVGDKTLLDVAMLQPTPALRWQLRNYPNQTQFDTINQLPIASALITPPAEQLQLNVGDPYVGQDFALNQIWSPVGLSPKAVINWLIYREAGQLPDGDKVVLWLRLNDQ